MGKLSAAILAAKRSVGVTPEVNLREHISCMPLRSLRLRLPPLAVKPREDITRTPKQGIMGPTKNNLCPPEITTKKIMTILFFPFHSTVWKQELNNISIVGNYNI